MDIEELLARAVESKQKKEESRKEIKDTPKSYYPSQCSASLLREVIKQSQHPANKKDADVQYILTCIKSRRKIVGGNERIRYTLDKLKNENSSSASEPSQNQ